MQRWVCPRLSPQETTLQGPLLPHSAGARGLSQAPRLSTRAQQLWLVPAGGLRCTWVMPHPAGVRRLGTMVSTHMQQSMQEAAAESVRRLWDRSREGG